MLQGKRGSAEFVRSFVICTHQPRETGNTDRSPLKRAYTEGDTRQIRGSRIQEIWHAVDTRSIVESRSFGPSLPAIIDARKRARLLSWSQMPLLPTSLHFFISNPAGGVPSTFFEPTSLQFVLSTVPPLSWNDLFIARRISGSPRP